MKKEELESHLLVGREKAVCIDISIVPAIPGQVRGQKVQMDEKVRATVKNGVWTSGF